LNAPPWFVALAVASGLEIPPLDAGAPRADAPASSEHSIVTLRARGAAEVFIPAGTFLMGSDPPEIEIAVDMCKREPLGDDNCEKAFANELEAHPVMLSAFYIDRTEVTVAAFTRCVELGRCVAPPFAAGGERFHRPDYPVTLVSWEDANTYCRFQGGRLPTEAEWERAARGLARRAFPWGKLYNASLANHGAFALDDTDDGDGFSELAPVGSFPLGRTPDGIDDMAGNAEEWVLDAIDDLLGAHYPAASEVNPKGAPGGALRVARGGSYGSGAPWLRGATRGFHAASTRSPRLGFRCVRPLDEGV
jgi:formylglycine-generating enzyme required for sulfatase activity